MEQTTTAVVSNAPSEADSFEEHKKLRSAPPAAAKPGSSAEGEIQHSDSKEETVQASETGKEKSTQEKKKERSLDGRISELTAKRKAAEDERDALKRELEELRKGTRKPEETKAAETKPAETATNDDPEPTEDDPKYKTYKDFLRDYTRWEIRQERKVAEQQSRQTEAQHAHQQKLNKAREKYVDFDAVVQAGIAGSENVRNIGIEAALSESDATGDLIYHFAKNMDEYRRIAALPPQQAYRATVALELKLSDFQQTNVPEKQKPSVTPITRAPAPPTPVSGVGAPTPKSLSESGSYEEYKRLRRGT